MKFGKEDTKIIGECYELAEQFATNIMALAKNAEVVPSELPVSELPTHILLNMCIAYSIMYDRLEEMSLLSKLTSTKTQH